MYAFHKFKYPIDIIEVNIGKIVISIKVSHGKKGFIGYKDDDKIKRLCIMLPKMSGYLKCFDENKYVFFY